MRLTFKAIEHVSIFFSYSLEFNMYRYLFMQKISTYRYVLVSTEILNISIRFVVMDFNTYRHFLFHRVQYALARSYIHKNATCIDMLLQDI